MRTFIICCLAAVIAVGATGCTTATRSDSATSWQRSELYFGLSRRGKPDVSEADWRDFVTNQVVPSFPGGFTELPAQGHFREDGVSKSEPVRVLVVLNPPDQREATNRKLDALGRAYCARFGQDAVLRADSNAALHFLSAE